MFLQTKVPPWVEDPTQTMFAMMITTNGTFLNM